MKEFIDEYKALQKRVTELEATLRKTMYYINTYESGITNGSPVVKAQIDMLNQQVEQLLNKE